MSDADFHIVRNAGRPPPKRGRKSAWDLPLSNLVAGDMLHLPMTEEEARGKVAAVRSYANRAAKKLGCKFSVRATAKGIEIWR